MNKENSYFNSWNNKKNLLNYNSKYEKQEILNVLNLLKSNLQIREISRLTNVPETTIRNWKYGYSNLFGKNNKLDKRLKKEIIRLLNCDFSIPEISRKLKINYEIKKWKCLCIKNWL